MDELVHADALGVLRQLCLAEGDHLAQDRAAAIHLLLQQRQILVQQRVAGVFAAQLRQQRAHGRQRRVQLMRGTGCLGGDGQDALAAQGTFAHTLHFFLLITQHPRQTADEEAQQQRHDDEVHAHPRHVQREPPGCAAMRGQRQRHMGVEQDHVGHAGQCGHRQHRAPGQRRRGERDRHQQQGDERVAGAAGEIQQVTQHQRVERDVANRFPLAQRPRLRQSPGGKHGKHRQHADAQQQRQQRDLQVQPPCAHQHRGALAGDGTKPQPRQCARECVGSYPSDDDVLWHGGQRVARCRDPPGRRVA